MALCESYNLEEQPGFYCFAKNNKKCYLFITIADCLTIPAVMLRIPSLLLQI